LPSRPPGNTTVYHGDDLLAMPTTPAANWLEDDAAESRQPENGHIPRLLIKQVELEP
jgi:hypothetical protein